MKEIVYEAAMHCLEAIKDRNGGRLPVTLQECRALPERFGLLLDYYDAGGGKLVILPDETVVIYTNPADAAIRQMCDIVHEITEWLAITESPTLFDGTVTTVYHASGAGAPRDIRHRIALLAERIYRAWLETVR